MSFQLGQDVLHVITYGDVAQAETRCDLSQGLSLIQTLKDLALPGGEVRIAGDGFSGAMSPRRQPLKVFLHAACLGVIQGAVKQPAGAGLGAELDQQDAQPVFDALGIQDAHAPGLKDPVTRRLSA